MGFVPADVSEYPETAALLLQMTADAGLHVRDVRTVPGGFEVPDVVSSQLVPPADPVVPDSAGTTGAKTPPPGWDDPLPTPDVEFKPDGRVVLTEDARAKLVDEVKNPVAGVSPAEKPADSGDARLVVSDEEKRVWAKEAGLKVADKGRLSKAVLEAFDAAHDG